MLTYSYVSIQLMMGLNLVCDILDYPIFMSLMGESVIVTYVYCSCPILFVGFKTYVDLVILDILDFDVTLDMTGLSTYNVVLNCNAKIVTLSMPVIKELEWERVHKANQ